MRNNRNAVLSAPIGALLCLFVLMSTSCKKSAKEEDDRAGKKVTDIIPDKFLSTVQSNGMTIYPGTTPPTLDGKFRIGKLRADYSNWREPGVYPQPGTIQNANLTLVISNQQANQDITLATEGYYLGEEPLKNAFITGSGNNFTLCVKTTMVGGMSALFSYPYAVLISGTLDGNTLKNVHMAKVGLEYTNSQGFSVAGQVDIQSDADGVSEKMP